MQELVQLTSVLADAFRCHLHHFQCLSVPVELSNIENGAHDIEKLLLKLK